MATIYVNNWNCVEEQAADQQMPPPLACTNLYHLPPPFCLNSFLPFSDLPPPPSLSLSPSTTTTTTTPIAAGRSGGEEREREREIHQFD